MIAVAALLLGGIVGFFLGSSRTPNDVLVPGRPTTLHLYRFDPAGSLPKPGSGETVIFDQGAISRIAAEVNRLPSFPRIGRQCDPTLSPRGDATDSALFDDVTTLLKPRQ